MSHTAISHYTRRGISGYRTPVGWGFSDAWDAVSDTVSDVASTVVDRGSDAYSFVERNAEKAGKIVASVGLITAGIATLNPALIAAGVSTGYDEAKQVANWVSNGSKGTPPATPNLGMILSSANSDLVNQLLTARGYGYKVSRSNDPSTTVVTLAQLDSVLPQNPEQTKEILRLAGYTEKSSGLLWVAAVIPFLGF